MPTSIRRLGRLGGSRALRLERHRRTLVRGRPVLGLQLGSGLLRRLLRCHLGQVLVGLLIGHLCRALCRRLVVVEEGLRDLEGAELAVPGEDTMVLSGAKRVPTSEWFG